MKEYKFKINGTEYAVSIQDMDGEQAAVTVNGTNYNVEVTGMAAVKSTKTPKVVQRPVGTTPSDAHPAVSKTAKPSEGAKALKSPLPGVILEVKVREGDAVTVGQTLLVLEAMKMENNIDSDKAGTVKSIQVNKGDSVLEGDVLLTIE